MIEFRAAYSGVKDMYFQLAVIQKKMSTIFSFEKYLMCVCLELASSLFLRPRGMKLQSNVRCRITNGMRGRIGWRLLGGSCGQKDC